MSFRSVLVAWAVPLVACQSEPASSLVTPDTAVASVSPGEPETSLASVPQPEPEARSEVAAAPPPSPQAPERRLPIGAADLSKSGRWLAAGRGWRRQGDSNLPDPSTPAAYVLDLQT